MAWRRPGDKPLSETMMVRLPTHICVTRPQWVKACVFHSPMCRCKFQLTATGVKINPPHIVTSRESHDVPNHRQLSCSIHRLFILTTKTPKPRILAHDEVGNPPVTGDSPHKKPVMQKTCVFSLNKTLIWEGFPVPWRHYELWGQTQTLFLKHTDHLPVWFSIHYAQRRLTTKSHEDSKPRDWMLWRSYRPETWEASRQHFCRDVCQISELLEKTKPKSRGFETSQRSPVRSVSI